ncbi:gamma-glutamylcyclotransferase [Aliiroseovarius sp. PrR006]|uniref:gamma-glutamylcyclotransferase n=1 Tax=Aliiroseovarius sp. PrR006 TaxID=2706883 RepID=UPI0013CFB381|nr:gamma-glutamylcyclotransferase [Aliiroseovarius sp. PrR006]NDW52798.1 gamma-glutamylcyclotransferase [Aliiroseovarius sp. PrR006]
MNNSDPYRHHPELRGKIKPASESFFRDVDLDVVDANVAKAGLPSGWRTPCAEREAERREWLKERWGQDLWVFGYGSLMWDPSIEFVEVRRAHCLGYQRSFCLWDEGGRGTVNEPGLMLAIDEGGKCDGLALRIEADKVDHETFVLFRREMIAPAYQPDWLSLDTAAGPIEALGFVANRDNKNIRPGIPLHDQAEMIAQAEGFLGTNYDYLSDTQKHLDLLGIDDPYIAELCAAVGAFHNSST